LDLKLGMTKTLRFLLILLVICTHPIAEAINTISDGFRVNNATISQIDAHGTCTAVINNSGQDQFIATRSSTEWSSFRSTPPTGVVAGVCCQPGYISTGPTCALNVSVANSTITGTTTIANGVSISTISITLRDPANNPIVGMAAPTFSATDTNATNVYGACSVTDSSGVSTCTMTATKAEVKTLTITGPITKTGGTATFTHGPASQLAWQSQPNPEIKAGRDFSAQIQVLIYDAFNNLVNTGADSTANVTLSLNSGSGTLLGTLTKAAVGGLASFTGNNISILELGLKTILATKADRTGSGGVGVLTLLTSVFEVFPIICDSGALSADCFINADQDVASGVTVEVAGNLTIQNGGRLHNLTNQEGITFLLGGDLIIQNGGKIESNIYSLSAANVIINAGGVLTAEGLGYYGGRREPYNLFGHGQGPAGGFTESRGAGGGHAGRGADGTPPEAMGGTINYGSITDPNSYGSGGSRGHTWGSPGSDGGGIIRINVGTGNVVINGTLSVAGVTYPSWEGSGGAGGSVRIDAAQVTGSGLINASGANPYDHYWGDGLLPGGGGGGRIAIYAQRPFTGRVRYAGGMGAVAEAEAAQGSFYQQIPNQDSICDTGTWATTCTISTARTLSHNYLSLSGNNLTITSTGSLNVRETKDWLTLNLTGNLTIQGILRANIKSLTAGLVNLANEGQIIGNIGSPDAVNYPGMVVDQLSVNWDARIDADQTGYEGGFSGTHHESDSPTGYNGSATGRGPGGNYRACVFCMDTGPANAGAGASYGGVGGNAFNADTNLVTMIGDGATYGSVMDPSDYGSGSAVGWYRSRAGSNGGGLIRIQANTSMAINGTITANGGTYDYVSGWSAGGGSGGGIKLTTPAISGAGVIRANGGNGNGWASGRSGGGGGGRVAILRTTSTYSGIVQAIGGNSGGAGATAGTAGSVYQGLASSVPAVTRKLEVPIELLDYGLASTASDIIFERTRTSFDPTAYDGVTGYFFEVVATNSGEDSIWDVRSVQLVDSSGIVRAAVPLPSPANSPRRYRVPFFPRSTANNYRIKLPAGINTTVLSARIIVQQVGATKTKLYIPMIGRRHTLTSTADGATAAVDSTTSIAYTQTSPNYYSLWRKEAAKYADLAAGSPWSLEAVVSNSAAARTTSVALFNQTSGNAVTGAVASLAGSSLGLATVSFANTATNFTDGSNFELRLMTNNSAGTAYVYKAGLWVTLTNLSKAQIKYRVARLVDDVASGDASAAQRIYIDPSRFTNPKFYSEFSGNPTGATATYDVYLRSSTNDVSTPGTVVPDSTISLTGGTRARYRSGEFSITAPIRYLWGYTKTNANTGVMSATDHNVIVDIE
jgi:hypothetical protein